MKRLLIVVILLLPILIAQAVGVGETYRIISKKYSDKSLFIKDSQREANADVVLWTETNVPSQQWKVVVCFHDRHRRTAKCRLL